MHYQNPDRSMRNIKKAATGGFQIQFMRDHKSYSAFSMDLEEAKKIRDQMEKSLEEYPEEFRLKPQIGKGSCIPGTNQPMYSGISLAFKEKKAQYAIQVVWRDDNNKVRTKAFYAGTVNTFSEKGIQAYMRALEFRQSWEDAVTCNRLNEFDPSVFGVQHL